MLIDTRPEMRARLLSARTAFVQRAAFAAADAALYQHLLKVLTQLQPDSLGVYWPLNFEFNAARPWAVGEDGAVVPLALPFARKRPHEMHYVGWDGQTPSLKDEQGIPSAVGPPMVPDVVLVPCLGYTAQGYRMGYGAGYFDRYLAQRPHLTTVGVAWSVGAMEMTQWAPMAHDQMLTVVVTELGVVN